MYMSHLCLKYNLLDFLLGMMYFTKTLRRIMRSPRMYSSEKVIWIYVWSQSLEPAQLYIRSNFYQNVWSHVFAVVYDEFRQKASSPLTGWVFSLVSRIAATFAMQWLGTRLILCWPKFNERCGPANLQGIGRPTWGQGWSNCLFNHVTINADQAKHRLIWVLGIVFTGIPRMENKL